MDVTSTKIQAIEKIDKPKKVYNIEVEDNHNYFANNILVGNSHITLSEPMPNPIFVGSRQVPGAAVVLSGLQYKEFDDVIHGKKDINGKTGGKAIKELLDKVNVKEELAKIEKQLPKLKGAELNSQNRKVKYLRALDKLNIKPSDAYIVNHIPVLPPIYRPITPMEDGSITSADINTLYKMLIENNNQLKTIPKELPESEKVQLRGALYDSLKAISGMGSVPTYEGNKKLKGILQTIAGDSPKFGFFQSKIMKRRQELSMRSTITPATEMHIDQVGIPKEAAMDLYKPFVIRELTKSGKDIIDAQKEVKNRTSLAWKALENATKTRPVLLKRDPVLHKYNIQAFFPKLIEGNAIQLHPLLCPGYNADNDGDKQNGAIIIFCVESFLDSLVQSPWLDKEYRAQRRIPNMPFFNTKIGLMRQGSFYVCDLSEVPRTEELISNSSDKDFYKMPRGVFVICYDQFNNKLELAEASTWSLHKNKEAWIVNLHNGKQIISDDDPRAVYGIEPTTLNFVRKRPNESKGILVPISKSIEEKTPHGFTHSIRGFGKLKEEIELTKEVGYLLGALCGDGWYDDTRENSKAVHLAGIEREVTDYYQTCLPYIFKEMPRVGYRDTSENAYGRSEKWTVASVDYAKWVAPLIGKRAENKHLPPFWFSAPEEFKWGLLSGIMDTDGSFCIGNGKSKPQLLAVVSSNSLRMLYELKYLLQSLGIGSNISFSKITSAGNKNWQLNISSVDIYKKKDKLCIKHLSNIEALSKCMPDENSASYIKNDIVPIDKESVLVLQKGLNKIDPSLYTVLSYAKTRGYLSRVMAIKVLKIKGVEGINPTFIKIVEDKSTTWSYVESFEQTGKFEDGYDLTVPGYETFMSIDGIILSNTMAAYLPVTEEARREAIEKMLPSNNLFSTTTYGVLHAPDQEAVMGLHFLSKWGPKKDKNYKSETELLADKSIHINDVVKLNGRETTKGRMMLVEKFPDKFKTDDLKYSPEFKMKKKWLYSFLEQMARHDPKQYPEIVNHLKDIGNKTATTEGLTFSLKDLQTNPEKRDAILKPYHLEAAKITSQNLSPLEKEDKLVQLWSDATDHMDKLMHEDFKKNGNAIYTSAIEVGGKGSKASVRQMLEAPMQLRDATNKIVLEPVTRSYSEGLDVAQYWTTLHGARKGTIQKVEGTQEPGRLTKEIVNLNLSTLVTQHDCGTKHGIKLPVEEIDVIERFTSKPIHINGKIIPENTLVTPELIGQMKKHDIKDIEVRSVHKCMSDNGVCSKCVGHNSDGRLHEIGTNVGIIASQALGEPSMQMALDSFHCLHKDSIAFVQYSNQEQILYSSLEDIWNDEQSPVIKQDNQEIKLINNLRVWDGRWVKVKQILRHKPDSKMVSVSNQNLMLIAQDTHPIATWQNLINCIKCGYHRLKLRTNSKKIMCPKCKLFQEKQNCKMSPNMKFMEIKDIENDRHYIHHSIPLNNSNSTPPHIDPYLAGFFVAEGCVIYVKDIPNRVVFSQNDGIIKDYVKSLIPQNWRPKVNYKGIVCNDTKLAKFFSSIFPRYARNKALPNDFINYPNEWLSSYLCGLIDGDGTIKHFSDGPSQINIDTTSFKLVQQVSFICHKLGIVSNIVTTPIRELTRYQGFRINLRMTKLAKDILKNSIKVQKLPEHCSPEQSIEKDGYRLITNIKEVMYDDYVYDLTTETGTLYISGIKQHNTGGTAMSRGGASASKIDRLDQLLNLPKELAGHAILVHHDGPIQKIEKDPVTNGHNVYVNNEKHFVPQDRYLKVKEGDTLKKGDPLTYGPINPHQLLPLKGIEAVRNYITEEMYNGMYKDERVRRRNVEIVTKNLTNLAQIKEAGNSHYLSGDTAPITEIEKHNRQAKKEEDKIIYKPTIKGANQAVSFVNDDLLSSMNFQRIQGHLLQAANTRGGWKLHGLNPIPAIATSSISNKSMPNY